MGFSFYMSTQQIFNELLTGESITMRMTRSQSESMRVALWKKFRAYRARMGSLATSTDLNSTVRCTFEAGAGEIGYARFKIVSKRKAASYEIVKESSDETVHSNLEQDQECKVRNMGAGENPSQHGTDTDSSSPQGEDSGSGFDEKDWGDFLRTIGAQG